MVTVIIPFYNAGEFLSKSIKSVVMQTYGDWELILINDASTDNSKKIAASYKTQNSRIHLINNTNNLGVDHSRFKGIELAKGEYIMFVDADDWLAPTAIERLLKKLLSENADVAVGAMVRVLDRFGIIKSKPQNSYSGLLDGSIENPELFDKYFISFFGVNLLFVNMCGKLYKLSSLKSPNITPSGMTMGEDLLFNMYLHPYLRKITFVSETIYYYRFGGMTNTSNPLFLENMKKQYDIKIAFSKRYNYIQAENSVNYELINCFFSHFENRVLLDGVSKETIHNEVIEELQDPFYKKIYVNSNFRRYDVFKTADEAYIAEYIYRESKSREKVHKLKKVISKILR